MFLFFYEQKTKMQKNLISGVDSGAGLRGFWGWIWKGGGFLAPQQPFSGKNAISPYEFWRFQ